MCSCNRAGKVQHLGICEEAKALFALSVLEDFCIWMRWKHEANVSAHSWATHEAESSRQCFLM